MDRRRRLRRRRLIGGRGAGGLTAASAAWLAATVTLWLAAASLALADSPAPSQADIGDPRGGQAATLAGNPGLAIAVVILVALVAVVVTLAWIRATGGPNDPTDRH